MVGVAQLRRHNEWLMMSVLSLSSFDRLKYIMKFSVCLVLIFFVLGEGITVPLANWGRLNKLSTLTGHQMFSMSPHQGVWLHEQGCFIYVKDRVDSNNLKHLWRYCLDEQGRLYKSSYADSAHYSDRWRLKNIHETRFYWTD